MTLEQKLTAGLAASTLLIVGVGWWLSRVPKSERRGGLYGRDW